MKKLAVLFSVLILALSLTACGNSARTDGQTPQADPQQNAATSGESAEESNETDAAHALLEQETYELLLDLYQPALNAFFWYHSDPAEDLQILTEGEYAAGDDYRPVGKFATIDEMKAATEQFFTKEFCETIFYEPAFNQYAMYKEMDGQLYRNIQIGGIGWPFALTDKYELAYADDQWRVLTMGVDVFGETEWRCFVFQKEDGAWKFHHFYDFSPWGYYESAAEPLLSSAIAAYNWEQSSDLEPVYFASYYIYQFLSDLDGDYSDATPYVVAAADAVENLSRHFEGMNKDVLIAAAQNEYSSVEYDEAADSFLFYITFDGAPCLVLNVEQTGGEVVLQSLAIGKSGKAVRWSYLTAREGDDGLYYLSNRVEEIAER
jgi:hypothetical protein